MKGKWPRQKRAVTTSSISTSANLMTMTPCSVEQCAGYISCSGQQCASSSSFASSSNTSLWKILDLIMRFPSKILTTKEKPSGSWASQSTGEQGKSKTYHRWVWLILLTPLLVLLLPLRSRTGEGLGKLCRSLVASLKQWLSSLVAFDKRTK